MTGLEYLLLVAGVLLLFCAFPLADWLMDRFGVPK